MSPQVMALKWRPQTFADLVGQEHVTKTLQNAILNGRLAHAYIFAGPRGVGKTTTARLFAKALNCRSPKDTEPCNACDVCQEVSQGSAMDVIEIDAASVNGIDGIRELQTQVGTFPLKGKYKVYIFDEAHRISKPAFDAFLKTLEEPPAHVVFILASTEIHNIPVTVQSRCQRFEFRSMGLDTLLAQLKRIAQAEGLTVDEKALYLVARTAGGSMRDAQRTLDQVVAFCGKDVTLKHVRDVLGAVETEVLLSVAASVLSDDAAGALSAVRKAADSGRDLEQFYRGLLEIFRHLAVARAFPRSAGEVIPLSAEETARIVELSAQADDAYFLSALRLLIEQEHALRHSSFPQVVLETLVMELSRLRSLVDVDEALASSGGTLPRYAPPPRRVATVGEDPAPASPETAPPAAPAAGPKADAVPSSPDPSSGRQDEAPPLPAPEEPGEPVLAVSEISEAVPADAPPELSKVKSCWSEFLEKVRAANRALHGVMLDTRPGSWNDGNLTLVCKGAFHRDQVEKEENRKTLEVLLEQSAGFRSSIRAALADEASAPRVQRGPGGLLKPMGGGKPDLQEISRQEPFVDAVVKLFNGKVVDVKRSHPKGG